MKAVLSVFCVAATILNELLQSLNALTENVGILKDEYTLFHIKWMYIESNIKGIDYTVSPWETSMLTLRVFIEKNLNKINDRAYL